MITELTGTERKAAQQDKMFIQEVLNDLYRNGFTPDGKAAQMLHDWSGELRITSGLRGRTRRTHAEQVGKQNW